MASTEGRDPDSLTARPLGPDDIDAAMALSAEAGWNQCAADWRAMLRTGEGHGLAEPGGRLVATAMLLPYGDRFAWIAMILVTADWQRRGLATRLMRWAIGRCREEGWIAGLDATDAGRQVYAPLGFRDIYGITRWMCEAAPALTPDRAVTAIGPGDLVAVAAWDAATFGADRSDLLAGLRARRPELALMLLRDGALAGFALAREGRLATQLGPLVAVDRAAAAALLTTALARVDGPVFLDAADSHGWLAAQLPGLGFRRQRGYTRMLLDRNQALDDPARVVLITGPEFG